MEHNKYPVEMNYEELRVLNLAMDNIIKHSEVANSLYAGDKTDISLINGVAGRIRGTYQIAKNDRAAQADFEEGFNEAGQQ